jgi:hypothetical protein
MKKTVTFLLIVLFLGVFSAKAQQIVFSEPERDDAKTLNFEVLGKMDGNFLVYKNTRELHQMCIYDAGMKLVEKLKMDYLSEKGKVLSTDFVVYSDFAYLLYQYQYRNTVFAMAVKLNASGNKMGDPIMLDTTNNINFNVENKIYTFINSEDKQKISAFKISTKNEKEHVFTSIIFDKMLNQLEKVRSPISMSEKNDFLSEFGISNDGEIICLKQSGTNQNDNISKVSLLVKSFGSISFKNNNLLINKIFLDDTRVKIDNRNKHFIVTSFFSKIRRGNVDGIYYTLWDANTNKEMLNATTTFTDEYRADVKNDGQLKMAFNDFYLRNLILRKDGGFMIIAEAEYVTTRGNTLNRWDYMNGSLNPFFGGGMFNNFGGMNNFGGGMFNNFGGMNNFPGNNSKQFYADNVAIISFEPDGKMEWSNVIRKAQSDDETDNFISYGIVNSGDQIHFLFNIQDKKSSMLTDQAISPVGQIDRSPTLKNLDKGYDFMPKHVKQVGLRQAIVPCIYRGYTIFAKIDF